MLSRSQRALKPSHRRRLSSHKFGYLRLRETGLLARLEQGIQQDDLVSLDTFDFSAYTRTAHEFLYQLIMCLHV